MQQVAVKNTEVVDLHKATLWPQMSENVGILFFLFYFIFSPSVQVNPVHTGPLNPPFWHLHMAGKCFIFAPIWLRCCVAYLTACSDIWVWPFCAARVNHWNKSIDIRIIKPFTFRYIWKRKMVSWYSFFVFPQNEREQIMTTNLWLFQVC